MNAVVLVIGWLVVALGAGLLLRGLIRRVRVLLLLRRATYRAPKDQEPEEPQTLQQKYGD